MICLAEINCPTRPQCPESMFPLQSLRLSHHASSHSVSCVLHVWGEKSDWSFFFGLWNVRKRLFTSTACTHAVVMRVEVDEELCLNKTFWKTLGVKKPPIFVVLELIEGRLQICFFLSVLSPSFCSQQDGSSLWARSCSRFLPAERECFCLCANLGCRIVSHHRASLFSLTQKLQKILLSPEIDEEPQSWSIHHQQGTHDWLPPSCLQLLQEPLEHLFCHLPLSSPELPSFLLSAGGS